MSAVGLALRLGRWGILGFSILAFVSTIIQALGFYAVAGPSESDRVAFANSISILASRFTVLLAPPLRPDTVGGYVQYRAYGGLTILFAIWALMSASGAMRGDEERGLIEAALATGLSRARLVASRVVAFGASVFVASMVAGTAFMIGARTGGESVAFRGVLEAGVLLAALALCCYGVALLTVQFATARFATAAAAIVLLVLFLDNSLSRTFTWLAGARWLSPFRYYDLSQPLVTGGAFDAQATAALALAGLVAATAAVVLFSWRDVGSPLFTLRVAQRPPGADPSDVVFWRVPIARDLYEHRIGLVAWTVGVAALAALFVLMTRSVVEPLLDIRSVARFFGSFVHGEIFASFLGFFWFSTAQLMFATFALVQVGRWAAEDGAGRLGLVLSQPVSRSVVVVERATSLTAGAAFIALVSAVAVAVSARSQAIDLDATRLVEDSLLLVPFTLVFGGAGSLLAAWKPRAAVGLLGAIVFAGYLDDQVGLFFKWPEWVQDLSPFKLFGNPMSDGVDTRNLALMLLIALAAFGTSILALQRRDVGD